MSSIPDPRPSPIRIFGELEFWLSSIKVLTLIGMRSCSLVTFLDRACVSLRTNTLRYNRWYVSSVLTTRYSTEDGLV